MSTHLHHGSGPMTGEAPGMSGFDHAHDRKKPAVLPRVFLLIAAVGGLGAGIATFKAHQDANSGAGSSPRISGPAGPAGNNVLTLTGEGPASNGQSREVFMTYWCDTGQLAKLVTPQLPPGSTARAVEADDGATITCADASGNSVAAPHVEKWGDYTADGAGFDDATCMYQSGGTATLTAKTEGNNVTFTSSCDKGNNINAINLPLDHYVAPQGDADMPRQV